MGERDLKVHIRMAAWSFESHDWWDARVALWDLDVNVPFTPFVGGTGRPEENGFPVEEIGVGYWAEGGNVGVF
jgi:hypothetical protein